MSLATNPTIQPGDRVMATVAGQLITGQLVEIVTDPSWGDGLQDYARIRVGGDTVHRVPLEDVHR